MNHLRTAFVWLAAIFVLFAGRVVMAAPQAAVTLDCDQLDCAAVLPGATKFQAPEKGGVYLEGLAPDGEVIGWVALSTDVVDIKAYSGKPLVTLVGLTTDGVIAGARVIEHSEPILLVGIPEKALHDFVDYYPGKRADTKIVVGSSPDPDAITVDVISGATVTALAQNATVLETARKLGAAVGVIEEGSEVQGHFVREDEPWTWQRMVDEGVFGRLTVSEEQMGVEGKDGPFIDLWFTMADPPQIGRALIGEGDYEWLTKKLEPEEHLLVVLGNGSSSFKGSGFVRGGIFDRIRLDQELESVMFRDRDYHNLGDVPAEGAPEFDEGAVFIIRDGRIDPGAPFELDFIGSRYDGKGGFSREFIGFSATHQLPQSVYAVQGRTSASDGSQEIWRQAWHNQRYKVLALVAVLLFVFDLFVARRWLTRSMRRLNWLHTGVLVVSFVGLGLILRAQPSITQVLTFIDSVVHEWRWGLFLMEPLLFVFWIFIAIVVVVWGRGVFCGWLCPYGAMTELMFKLGRWLKLPSFELPERAHRWLRYTRYVILAGLIPAFLISPVLGEKLAEIEPFKTTFFVVPWTRQWLFFGWWLLLLVPTVVVYRPFCRYLCPLGAALALPSSFRRSGPRRRRFCSSCTICTRGCEPRAIRSDGTIDSRECLSCMECEANYRDEQVCPPLVGIDRLSRKIHSQPLSDDERRRMERLQHDAKTV